MTDLYIDDFVKRQGFDSTEDYLRFCKENRMPAHFEGAEYFSSLFQKSGIILPFFTAVRTMYNQGGDDGFYHVTEDGKLEGVELPHHSGREGVHEPADILSLEKSSKGWDLEKFRLGD